MRINLGDIKPLQQNLEFAKQIYKYQVNYTDSGVYLFHDDIQDAFSNQFIYLTNQPLDLAEIKQHFANKNKKLSIVIPSFILFPPLDLLRANSMEVFTKEVYMAYEKTQENKPPLRSDLVIKADLHGDTFKEIFTQAYSSPPTKNHPYGKLEPGYLKLIDNSYILNDEGYLVENFVVFLGAQLVGCVTLASNKNGSFIYNVGTLPQMQNEGIGSSMINYIIHFWKINNYSDTLFLLTDGDGRLQNWYTKLGFRTIFSQDIYRSKRN